jgi:hypothetical protein
MQCDEDGRLPLGITKGCDMGAFFVPLLALSIPRLLAATTAGLAKPLSNPTSTRTVVIVWERGTTEYFG